MIGIGPAMQLDGRRHAVRNYSPRNWGLLLLLVLALEFWIFVASTVAQSI